MKISFDYHGVIDQYPDVFRAIIKALRKDGHRVYIVTGTAGLEAEDLLEKLEIEYDQIFSITDELTGYTIPAYINKDKRLCFDDKEWDKAKGKFCFDELIDLHLDDTIRYTKYFKTPVAIFEAKKK